MDCLFSDTKASIIINNKAYEIIDNGLSVKEIVEKKSVFDRVF